MTFHIEMSRYDNEGRVTYRKLGTRKTIDGAVSLAVRNGAIEDTYRIHGFRSWIIDGEGDVSFHINA